MKPGNIVVFKLVSGEEMIGEVFNTFDQHEDIKNPAVVIMQRTESGMGVALMPYLPYCEGTITFSKSGIIATGEPSQNMVNEYHRIFGAGIQVAPASALAGLKVVS